MRDNTPQGVTPGSSDSLEGCNSVNTCSNGASEESIGIYAKSRYQWSGCLADLDPEPRSYGRLKPHGPLELQQWLRHQGGGWSSKRKVCLGSPLEGQHREAAKNSREYYRGRVVSLSTPKYPNVTQGSPKVVWLVLGPHHGDSHTQGSRCGGPATKDG